MPTGHNWNLTDKRKEYAIRQLEKQMSISSIALKFGIYEDVLSRKLREAGIDHRAVRRRGIEKLRKKAMEWITDIDDPKDRVNVALKYLAKYDNDQIRENDTSNSIDIDAAASKVIGELNVQIRS